MYETINITVTRSNNWVAARRLATGRNVPGTVAVPVDPADLSERARAILLQSWGGSYADCHRIRYDQGYCINPYSTYGSEAFRVDADLPTTAEIDAAIIAAADAIAAKKTAAETEAEARKAAAEASAAEWASLPLAIRASAKGVCHCVNPSTYQPGDPLYTSGTVKYPLDTLREYCPAAMAEASAESQRLAMAEKEVAAEVAAKAKAERDAAVQVARVWLAEWTRQHGGDLANARLAEGYGCWVAAAK